MFLAPVLELAAANTGASVRGMKSGNLASQPQKVPSGGDRFLAQVREAVQDARFTRAAPVVLDSTANGKLYLSSITLARFEENAGRTNTSLVRLEGHAAYGVERTAAAVRIAAS